MTDALLEALERSPLLEDPHVEFCPNRPPPPPTSTLRLIVFPKLREVRLSTFGNQGARLPRLFSPPLSVLALQSVGRIAIRVLPHTGSAALVPSRNNSPISPKSQP